MTLTGKQLIGQEAVSGTEKEIHAVNPATGEKLAPAYPGANLEQVRKACDLAWEAFDIFRSRPDEERAAFLETCADEIMSIGDALVKRAVAETPDCPADASKGNVPGPAAS